jgi:hypothetical protein
LNGGPRRTCTRSPAPVDGVGGGVGPFGRLVSSRSAERVLLSSFIGKEWHYEYLSSPGVAAQRVTDLVAEHGGATACNLRR